MLGAHEYTLVSAYVHICASALNVFSAEVFGGYTQRLSQALPYGVTKPQKRIMRDSRSLGNMHRQFALFCGPSFSARYWLFWRFWAVICTPGVQRMALSSSARAEPRLWGPARQIPNPKGPSMVYTCVLRGFLYPYFGAYVCTM